MSCNTLFEVCPRKFWCAKQVSPYISPDPSISTRIGMPDPKAGTCKMDKCHKMVGAWGEKELSYDI